MKKIFLFFGAVLMLACGPGSPKTNDNKGGADDSNERKFKHVNIPAMFSSPDQKMRYLAVHYWDNFDFADTSYIGLPEVTEQGFADYVNTLNHMPPSLARKSLETMLDRASVDKNMLDHFVELSEKYLYDPNSPMRNEENYIYVLEYIMASDKFDEIDKIRPQAQLRMALKNRVGQPAADFSYTLASGRRGKLYDIRADYTLLYINNPDCSACAALTNDLISAPLISAMVDSGELAILTVYPDEDLAAWRDHLKDMPAQWINSYDKTQAMRNNELYDLRAIPTLYLLDRDKNVLIKDAASAYVVEEFFAGMMQNPQ